MVRNIVGSLCLVGEGKKSKYWFNELVKKENRIYGGKKFPASGLHLVEIRYPKRFNIDIRSNENPVCENICAKFFVFFLN